MMSRRSRWDLHEPAGGRPPVVTDTTRRLIYAYLDGSDRSAHELINNAGLTGPQVRAALIDGIAAGWIRSAARGCYRATARPACCQGGYRKPDGPDRVAPPVVAARLRDFHRLITIDVEDHREAGEKAK